MTYEGWVADDGKRSSSGRGEQWLSAGFGAKGVGDYGLFLLLPGDDKNIRWLLSFPRTDMSPPSFKIHAPPTTLFLTPNPHLI